MRYQENIPGFLLGLALLLTGTSAGADGQGNGLHYEVTITNVTKAQVFSPPVLVTHHRSIALFEAGAEASAELAMVAEEGNGGPLADTLSGSPRVFEAQATNAPIPPGMSATYLIRGHHRFDNISIVAMLVNTNDAFMALDSRRLPRDRNTSRTFDVGAYDAGSEGNNEDCAFVPGPACPADSGNARSVDDAEGYVYVHNGIHGIADLAPAAYDWRNPVAIVTVRRAR
jgi:hypothetical protein